MRIRSVLALGLSFGVGFVVVFLCGSRALAQSAESAPPPPLAVEGAEGVPAEAAEAAPLDEPLAPVAFTAFERPFALGAYASGWAGSYLAGGIGGRARWEPFAELGIEVFGEGHIVEWNTGIRHDHQIGFNLYTPIAIEPWLRLRPLFGFCSVFSLVEPTDSSSPRADDVLFGAHAGLGLEVAVEAWGSFFVEAQAAVWAGHDRTQTRWTGAVEDTYAPFGTAQLIVGFAVHLGDP